MSQSERIVLDIETSTIPGVESFLGQIRAPANYKKPEAIEKYIAEAREKELDSAELDPDLCRIVAIAYQDVAPDIPIDPQGWTAADSHEERDMLEQFWKVVRAGYAGPKVLIGFNILDFDVPALLRRSLYLGVTAVKYDVSRFRHHRIVDIMQELSMDGKLKYRSKDWYCRRLGIVENGDPLESGASVRAAIQKGDYESVLAHAKVDVRKEYRLARALELF
jgi:3'-5' exonuclease